MRLLTNSDLSRLTQAELTGLFNELNFRLARSKPCSAEWHAAMTNIETLIRHRKARIECGGPRP